MHQRLTDLSLPLQASEAYLAGVRPADPSGVLSAEVLAGMEDLLMGTVITAHVVMPDPVDFKPHVELTVDRGDGKGGLSLNAELVSRGWASWLE